MASKAKSSPNVLLQLVLSRNDPLDASYFLSCNSYARSDASDNKTRRPLYIVSTSHASSSGAGSRVTTIDRILSPAPQPGGFNRSNTRSRHALRPSPLANANNASTQTQPRSYWSNSSASSSSGSDKDGGRVRVATITRPALAFALFTPVTVTLGAGSKRKENGKTVSAKELLKKAGLLSSTRVFQSASTGEELRWKLSTPTPKLYDPKNNRLAVYRRPYLPDASGIFSHASNFSGGTGPASAPASVPIIELAPEFGFRVDPDGNLYELANAEASERNRTTAATENTDLSRKGKGKADGQTTRGLELLDEVILSLVLSFCL